MTSQETLAWYVNNYDASDPFGSYNGRPANGPGHLGSDFNRTLDEGDEIPSWCAGTVVGSGYNAVVGWFVVVRTAGGWAMFYHLAVPGLTYGSDVQIGTILGRVGNTGTSSRGAHLHCGFSRTSSVAGTLSVVDPWPIIAASLIQTVAIGPNPLTESDNPMFWLRNNNTNEVHLFGHAKEGHKHVRNPDELALLNTLVNNVRPPGIPVPSRDPAAVFGVNDDLWDIAIQFFGTPAAVKA